MEEGMSRGGRASPILVALRPFLGISPCPPTPTLLRSRTLTVEHLAEDGMRRPREVEVEAIVRLAEVVQLKDYVLGEINVRAPDTPSDADGAHAVLVSGRIDGVHTGHAEVPQQIWVDKGCHKATGGRVDVDRDVDAGFLLVLVQLVCDGLHAFECTSVGASENHEQAAGQIGQ